jgi:hypothetical protein
MPKMTLSHFETSIIFALLISIVLAIVTKKNDKDRLYYGLYCFGCFIATIFGLAWLMKLGHG